MTPTQNKKDTESITLLQNELSLKKDTESITLSQIDPILKKTLSKELDSFIQRNTLAHASGANGVLCVHCLKAHLLKVSQKSNRVIKRIKEVLPGAVGHQGYYVDGEDLCTITS